jgi:CRP/FNR family transcriptional regulator, cyclic AMP receptor protein
MQGTGSGQGFWTLLSRDEQQLLAHLGMLREYPSGATLCLEGDPATHVFILRAGWVKILATTTDGHKLVLALRGADDIVGEIAGETTGRRNATIQAIDDVHALIVRYDRFDSFLDANPGAGHAYRRVVMQKWNDTDAMLRRRAGTTGTQRLAALLLELAERHGRPANGAIYLLTPSLSQEELASLAGTSRATVTRAFGSWRKRGLIRTGQRRITIVDLSGLRRVAGQQTGPPPGPC